MPEDETTDDETTGDGTTGEPGGLRDYRSVIDDNRRWKDFVHRPGDIVVCTPPKCGTTWMQTIVATLIFGGSALPDPVMLLAPWIEMRLLPIDEVLSGLEAQTHRRSMKSHTPADGIPWFDDAFYIVVGRDGRDAFMSLVNHMRSSRADVMTELVLSAMEEGIDIGSPPPVDDIHELFAWWLEGGSMFHFISTYWGRRHEPNILFVHYNDLKADLGAEMHRVASFVGIDVPDDRWPALVDMCTFESMKARADEIAPFERVFEGGAESFLYKGTNDRWRDVLTPEEVAAYEERSAELLPADAREWLAGVHPAS